MRHVAFARSWYVERDSPLTSRIAKYPAAALWPWWKFLACISACTNEDMITTLAEDGAPCGTPVPFIITTGGVCQLLYQFLYPVLNHGAGNLPEDGRVRLCPDLDSLFRNVAPVLYLCAACLSSGS